MQIKNLIIHNFKGIEKMEMPEIPKPLVLTGPNGSGKSSIMEAIRFLLTGDAPSNPIKEGSMLAEVVGEIVMPDGSTTSLARQISPSKSVVKLNGKATTQKSVKEFIEKNFGISADNAKILTSVSSLADLDKKSFSDFLLGFMPVSINTEKLISLSSLVSEEAKKITEYLLPSGDFSFDSIKEAYSEAFNTRKALKKEYNDESTKGKWDNDVPLRKLSQVEKDIVLLTDKTSKLEVYKKELSMYNSVISKREAVANNIKSIEEQIVKLGKVEVPDEDKYNRLKLQEKDLQKQIGELTKTKSTLEANISMFNKTLKNLDKPICPISEKLICTTDKTSIKEDLNKLVADNQTEFDKAVKQINLLEDQIKNISSYYKEYDEKKNLVNRYNSLIDKKKNLELSLPELPDKPVEPKISANDLDRLSVLKAEKEQIILYNDVLEHRKKAEKAEHDLNVYNEIVDALNPKGQLYQNIFKSVAEVVINYCNEKAEKIDAGFSLNLVINDGVDIEYTRKGVTLPISNASSGEKAMLYYLILDAANAIIGYNILMMDDLDKLDNDVLQNFLNIIEEYSSSYDHIVLGMVNHNDTVEMISKFSPMLLK